MVKRVEELRQLEGVLGEVGRFRGRYALVDEVGGLRRSQPEFPKFIGVVACEKLGQIPGGCVAGNVSTESFGINCGLLEDAGRADYCVLRSRGRFRLRS